MKKNDLFTKVPSYENFSFDKTLIKNSPRKSFVLIHYYLESDFVSIVGFSDSKSELQELMFSQPHINSNRHYFYVSQNYLPSVAPTLSYIKDKCLINICKNVAEYLAVGEYAMLKKSYFKSSAWFEKAKNSSFLGADIIDNY